MIFTLCASLVSAQIPAFPGAEGFGGYATGGRGGDVYIVTNLNTSGAGSFADAIATVPTAGRTIVFGVGGHIHVNKTELSKSKVTIAGQTAPGDGIGFKDGTFIISGDDVVIRHARFRYGKKSAGGDCINLSSGTLNAILDQISIQFSTDENISSFNSPPENLTMQWALNGWGLESHSCGGLWDQNHATAHHSLWAHNHTRNPKARPNALLEWVNNVTFDWDIGFIMGDSDTPASWKANVRNCYFLAPAGNIRTKALEKANLDRNGVPNFSLYLNNCRHDSDGDGILNGTDKGYGIASGSYTTLAAPVAATGAVPVTLDDPTVAFKKVVSKAGALRLDVSYAGPIRDEVDARMVQNLVTQTRNHISSETSLGLTNGGFGTLNSTAAPVDADKDGMPDFYETAMGWNPAVQDHNTALANSGGLLTGTTFMPVGTVAGYTRLEEYLHFKSIPHGTVAKSITGSPTSIAVNMAKFTSGFSSSPVFTTANVVAGSVSVAGNVATFTPTLNFTGRARFDFTVTDSAGHSWTQTCALVVTNTSLPRDLKWKGSGAAWDSSSPNWLRPSDGTTVAFSNGDRVAIDQSGIAQSNVALTGTLAPTTVEVNAAGNYTFSGTGSIGSTGALTKRGSGTLTLTAGNSYALGTNLEEGTVTIGNGGSLGGGAVTMLDGTTLTNGYPTGNTNTFGADVVVPAGNVAVVNSGNRFTMNGDITGSGTLNLNVQTTVSRFDISGATAAFAGNVNFTGSGGVRLFTNGGSFNGFTNSTVNIGPNVSLQPQTNSGGNIYSIGALVATSAAAVLAGGSSGAPTYNIGGLGTSTTFSGAITGNSIVNKVGAGTLTLSGANTYSGATTVVEGGLAVNGSLASATTVANAAVLRGSGAFNGAVTMQAGSQVSPGAGSGQIGTLTAAGGLTATDTKFSIQLSSLPTGANDKLSITGGTGQVNGTNTFDIAFADGGLGAGNYKLVECTAGIPLNIGSGMVMNLTTDAPGGTRQTYALNRTAGGTAGGYIQLTVTGNAANLVWSGENNSAMWDLNATANFTGNTFYNFDSVTLDDTSANRTVTLAGTLEPRIVNVNTALGYTLTGAGSLGGTGTLAKTGTGTLTIANTNTFTGGTTLGAGNIQLANAAANAGGLGTGVVTLNGGTLKMFSAGDATHAGTLPNDLIVAGNATLQVAPRCGFSGDVSGAGTFGYYTTYVRADITGDWSAFSGTVNVTSDAGGGDYRIASSYAWPGLPLATVNLTANTYFYFSGISNSGAGTTIRVGEITGAAGSRLRGGVTGGRNFIYRIGEKTPLGGEAVFAGVIDEQNTGTTTTYIKAGAGIWRLSGSGSWNGATVVESGTLRIWPSGATPFSCIGATTVNSGATLDLGAGAFATEAINIDAGATLVVQDDFTITGDVNIEGAATIFAGHLNVNGDVVNNGTMRMHGLSTLNAIGEFTNNGLLDLLTSSASLPANFINNGTVILNTERRILTASKGGANFTLTAYGYAGHSYQLQSTSTLGGTWGNVGAQQNGTNAPLTFNDVGGATGAARFYRLVVGP